MSWIDNQWDSYSFFKGWIPAGARSRICKYVVIYDELTSRFYMALKTDVTISRGLKSVHTSSKSFVLCPNSSFVSVSPSSTTCTPPAVQGGNKSMMCGNKKCNKVHVSDFSKLKNISEYFYSQQSNPSSVTGGGWSGTSSNSGGLTSNSNTNTTTAGVSPTSVLPSGTCSSTGGSVVASEGGMTPTKTTSTSAPPPLQSTSCLFQNNELFIAEKGRSSFRVNIRDIEPTAGFVFTCALLKENIVPSCHPFLCEFGRQGNCKNGARCLFVHILQSKIPDDFVPFLTYKSLLKEALWKVRPTPEFISFLEEDLQTNLGIVTVGDVQSMSTQMFEGLSHRFKDDRVKMEFWMFLEQLREIDAHCPLAMALITFPGVTEEMASSLIPEGLPDVASLLSIKSKALYQFPFPISMLEACEKVRLRFDVDNTGTPPYSTIVLSQATPFFVILAKRISEFRLTHAHNSWRKQDATRPVVTCGITWVDPEKCKCMKTRSSGYMNSPNLTPMGVGMRSGSETLTPSIKSSVGGSKIPGGASVIAEDIPSLDHWCQCPRQCEIAVNYEMSTPSGSRCSEQNCMGKLASMGLPTSCVREVFVHGGCRHLEDPNPLFPCGVCENMLRRISKDVQREHCGDVMLYMFDCEENPRKLVGMPISEISHREGAGFRRFVDEDLKEMD